MRLFIFGLGYSARTVVSRMRPHLDKVWGTTRDPARLAEIEASGVAPLLFDGDAPRSSPEGEAIADALSEADRVLVSIAPDPSGDSVLRHFHDRLGAARPASMVYLSTVGVYGDHGGAWVDEKTECRPVSERSRLRVDAEHGWRRFSEETGVPVAIVRLAGIYGPGRGPFEKLRNGTARRIVKTGQVFNRIHVDDIAQIVEAAFVRGAGGIFNGSDDEPAPPEDVIAFAAELLGVPLPPDVAFEAAELTPMARSFYGENKRVANAKIKRDLGVRLAFPSYREGLGAVFANERDAAGRGDY